MTAEGFVLFGGGLVLAGAAWWALRHRRTALPAAGLLAAVLVAQAAATTAYGHQGKLGGLDDYPSWGPGHTARAEALAEAGGWPAYRTDPSRPALSGNDPLLLGGQGGSYYSSHTPAVFTHTMVALGAGWTSRGRNVQSIDNPVTDALFAVGARLRPDGTVRRAQVPPLVTTRPPGAPGSYGESPFANQELLLGARVYEDPLPPGICRAGTEAYLWAPEYNATARLADGPWSSTRRRPRGGPCPAWTTPGSTPRWPPCGPRPRPPCASAPRRSGPTCPKGPRARRSCPSPRSPAGPATAARPGPTWAWSPSPWTAAPPPWPAVSALRA